MECVMYSLRTQHYKMQNEEQVVVTKHTVNKIAVKKIGPLLPPKGEIS